MAPLLLADDCTVLPSEHVLHVINRRGAFDVKGRDVHRLHERLSPLLQGSHSEAQLLSGVPEPGAAALRAYLAAMREAGALRDAAPGEAAPGGEPRVRLFLDGPLRRAVPHGAVHLCFATPREAGRLLLSLGRGRRLGGRLDCVVDESGDAGRRDQRAAYARWLLRNAVDVPGPEGRVRVFRLGEDGTLARVAEARAGVEPHLIPTQMGLVRFADVDQVPLVVATASHPFFPFELTACGLDYPTVREHLVRAFVVHALRGARPGTLTDPAGPDAAPVFAPTLPELRALLVERAARNQARRAAKVDLLSEPGDHASVRYLRDVLRLRFRALPGRASLGPDGVHRLRCGTDCATSVLCEKALAEILFAAVLREYYPTLRGRKVLLATSHRAFASADALRGLVRRSADNTGVPGGTGARWVRRWGSGAWVAESAPLDGGGG
jgi:hypothetical protein